MPRFELIQCVMDYLGSPERPWSRIPCIPEDELGFYGQFEFLYLESEHYAVRHVETKAMWFVHASSPRKAVDAIPEPAKYKTFQSMWRQADDRLKEAVRSEEEADGTVEGRK